jgi:hypothetical protein
MSSRWEAPPAASPSANGTNGTVSGHYGPVSTSGQKRGRDGDNDNDVGRAAKNSRFDDE